jgi:hypothetical protein
LIARFLELDLHDRELSIEYNPAQMMTAPTSRIRSVTGLSGEMNTTDFSKGSQGKNFDGPPSGIRQNCLKFQGRQIPRPEPRKNYFKCKKARISPG